MSYRLLKKVLPYLVGGLLVAWGISLLNAATAATSFSYTIKPLGTLSNYPITSPWRINDAGQVVGTSRVNFSPITPQRAFLWQNNNITDLGTLGGNQSRAYDVNNKGQVVGMSLTSNGLYRAFSWQNGQMKDLGTSSGDQSSVAYAINDKGQVVGWSSQASYPYYPTTLYHAVLWKNGNPTSLGTLSGDNSSQVFNINKNGQIYGFSYIASTNSKYPETPRIFRWENNTLTNLGNLIALSGYTAPVISDINNKGQIVGTLSKGQVVDPLPIRDAFKWQNGTLTNLGNLGGTYTEPYDINEAGTVVGVAFISQGNDRAFIWRNGQMKDLNTFVPPNSGWLLRIATGINNKGQIVGLGKFNGTDTAFLLTPTRVTQ